MNGWESREHERRAEFSARAKAAGWAATRMGYRQCVHLVLNDKRVLLQEAPNHVPVLAQDLQYMLDELIELDDVRAALALARAQLADRDDRGLPP